jgi:formylglycine-generating enzyme required for sulfatase activity
LKALALTVGLWLCATAAAAQSVPIPGAQWRSILPTGTKEKTVLVAPFRLDRVPVTNAAFLAFVNANPAWQRGRVPATLADRTYLQHWRSPRDPGPNVEPMQPVTNVSWFAARAYCEARGDRLPTWHEWELASSADGHSRDARRTPGWQQEILNWYSRPSTQPLARVGSHPANVYGVQDLHGLVWEWVEDFNALMISADSREQGDPDVLKYCGSGALALEDRENYAVAMRLAMLSSLQASSTTGNLGFRCAHSAEPVAPASSARSWPAASLYQADATIETASGRHTRFAQGAGRVRIVTMFYASCPMACPLTIDTLKNIDAALTASERAKLDMLLLSMDPSRDTPGTLTALASERKIADPRWTLARASRADTRKLAAVLGIQYRELDNGAFEHSSALVLLDAEGLVVARSARMGKPAPEFLAAVKSALE